MNYYLIESDGYQRSLKSENDIDQGMLNDLTSVTCERQGRKFKIFYPKNSDINEKEIESRIDDIIQTQTFNAQFELKEFHATQEFSNTTSEKVSSLNQLSTEDQEAKEIAGKLQEQIKAAKVKDFAKLDTYENEINNNPKLKAHRESLIAILNEKKNEFCDYLFNRLNNHLKKYDKQTLTAREVEDEFHKIDSFLTEFKDSFDDLTKLKIEFALKNFLANPIMKFILFNKISGKKHPNHENFPSADKYIPPVPRFCAKEGNKKEQCNKQG